MILKMYGGPLDGDVTEYPAPPPELGIPLTFLPEFFRIEMSNGRVAAYSCVQVNGEHRLQFDRYLP